MLQKWRCDQHIKLFVFNNGWTEATKRFLSKTNHGDLNLLIDAHFDSSIGTLAEAATFQKILDEIKQNPEDLLFLTEWPNQVRAAKSLNIIAVLVMTRQNRNIDNLDEADKTLDRICSLQELKFEWSSKLIHSGKL